MNSAIARLIRRCSDHDQLRRPNHPDRGQPGHPAGLNSASVDLIYLDPPFNSNQNYAAPVGSAAAGSAFQDVWTLPGAYGFWS